MKEEDIFVALGNYINNHLSAYIIQQTGMLQYIYVAIPFLVNINIKLENSMNL